MKIYTLQDENELIVCSCCGQEIHVGEKCLRTDEDESGSVMNFCSSLCAKAFDFEISEEDDFF